MKTVKFKSYLKNVTNEKRDDTSLAVIDPTILRQSLETLVEMVTEMRLENKALVEQNNSLENDLANERTTVSEQHQALQQLREEFDKTNSLLGETLGTNHNWWVKSCELEAELNSIKGRVWWRMTDRITSFKFPSLTLKISLPKENMLRKIRRGTGIFINSLKSCLLAPFKILYFSLKIVGLAYPIKAFLRRFPQLERLIRQLMGRLEEADSIKRSFSVKEMLLRQFSKMIQNMDKGTKLSIVLRSLLDRRPWLKASLKMIISQTSSPPRKAFHEMPLHPEASSFVEPDLSGLTASARRLYKVAAKDFQVRSLSQSNYLTSHFSNANLPKFTVQARRLLKSI